MISRDKKEKKETRTLTDESVSFFFRWGGGGEEGT